MRAQARSPNIARLILFQGSVQPVRQLRREAHVRNVIIIADSYGFWPVKVGHA